MAGAVGDPKRVDLHPSSDVANPLPAAPRLHFRAYLRSAGARERIGADLLHERRSNDDCVRCGCAPAIRTAARRGRRQLKGMDGIVR